MIHRPCLMGLYARSTFVIEYWAQASDRALHDTVTNLHIRWRKARRRCSDTAANTAADCGDRLRPTRRPLHRGRDSAPLFGARPTTLVRGASTCRALLLHLRWQQRGTGQVLASALAEQAWVRASGRVWAQTWVRM